MRVFLAAILFPVFIFSASAQKIDFNVQDGFVAEGYDVVAYFSGKAVKGTAEYTIMHQGGKFKFSSSANLNAFKANPEKYVPQYGGWCAYAMGETGDKVAINPETFEIRDDKLYLFYNAYFTNTLKDWLKKPVELQKKADANWPAVMHKN